MYYPWSCTIHLILNTMVYNTHTYSPVSKFIYLFLSWLTSIKCQWSFPVSSKAKQVIIRTSLSMECTDSSTSSQQPHLSSGFYFHPTDEELVVHYLKKKTIFTPLSVAINTEFDLYKFDPWELPGIHKHTHNTNIYLFDHLVIYGSLF